MFSLAGKDNLIGGPGKDVVIGGSPGPGSSAQRSKPSGGVKHLLGGSGNDVVFGGKGSDNLLGNAGNDLVANGPNRLKDKLSAGNGNDVVGSFNEPASRTTSYAVAASTGCSPTGKIRSHQTARRWATEALSLTKWATPSRRASGMACLLRGDYQDPSKPEDYAKAQGLAKAFEKANINPLVGDWRRKRTCEEHVRRLKQAGLADQIPEWVAGAEFGGATVTPAQVRQHSDPCQGLRVGMCA